MRNRYIIYFFVILTIIVFTALYMVEIPSPSVIVNEKYRGRGIGFSLFSRFIKYSNDLKVKRVQWVVLEWNKSAIEFYKKNGAQVLDDWRVAIMNENAIKKFLQNEGI